MGKYDAFRRKHGPFQKVNYDLWTGKTGNIGISLILWDSSVASLK